jgi:uncharacterized membrane protein HdeD (DUF308 family)
VLVGNLPDPTSPGFIAVASIVSGFLGTTFALWQNWSRDDVRWTAFLWGYLGVGFGLLVYCASLIAELY